MKRKGLQIVLSAAIFLLALLLTLYPIISSRYNQAHQAQIQTSYQEVLEQTDTAELERVRKQAIAYNAAITPGTMGEAYSPNAMLAASRDYVNQLDVNGNGIMGYVTIPKIQVDLPIYHGTESETLDKGRGPFAGQFPARRGRKHVKSNMVYRLCNDMVYTFALGSPTKR